MAWTALQHRRQHQRLPERRNRTDPNRRGRLRPERGFQPDRPARPVIQQDVTGANPFDDYLDNTVTNLVTNPSPAPTTQGSAVTLTATVTSDSSQIPSGATVAFSQTTSHNGVSTSVIIRLQLGLQLVGSGAEREHVELIGHLPDFGGAVQHRRVLRCLQRWQLHLGLPGQLGQAYNLTPSTSMGANSQTNLGGCTACYYGESSNPDTEGDAFVSGALSGQLTIGTANNVIITGNLTYADCTVWTTGQSGEPGSFCPYNVGGTNDSLGLIADNYIEVNHPVTNANGPVLPSCCGGVTVLCDPSIGGKGLTVDATVLALTESFVVNNYGSGNNEGPLDLYGSIQQYARGPVGTFSGNTPASGYVKHYTWDPLLGLISPPSYLVPSTAPWVLTSVNANGGQGSTTICPPLSGIYAGGTPPTPIGQYCNQPVGGLPGYPASTAPSPPTNANATATIGGNATVTWTDPPNDRRCRSPGTTSRASPPAPPVRGRRPVTRPPPRPRSPG